MKIHFFIYSMSSGGAERVTASLGDYWAARGWSVTIVTLAGIDRDFYPIDGRIRRIGLGLDQASTAKTGALSNNYRRVRAIRRIMGRDQPDIAFGVMSTMNCLLALARTGEATITLGSEHIHPPLLPLNPAWHAVRRYAYGRLHAVSALTDESAAWIKSNTHAKRVPVIPNPIKYPLDRATQSPIPTRTDSDQKTLLAVGRLVAQKGFDRLLPVFAQLASEFVDWRLVIVGEGPDRSALEHQAAEHKIASKVVFTGAVTDIARWYQAADLYVMTSRGEGFPNTLMEALAYGLPAVSVDCDTGPRDILRHDIDGLLVPQNEPSALREALSRLMADRDLRARFAARAIDARQRFSVARIAALWERLFGQLGVRQSPDTKTIPQS